MFYHFSQNNSGGSFDLDLAKGITHHVIIEADNATEANAIAEGQGVYFYGCNTGVDCPCCGHRWFPAEEGDSERFPHVYGEKVEEYQPIFRFMKEGQSVCVHMKDGSKFWYG